LDALIDRASIKSPFESNSVEYTSKILQLLTGTFEKRRDSLLLDVGPVCNENIEFFARRVKRLYVCDIFARLDRGLRKGLKPDFVWRHLDYAPCSFDAINLWDLVEHLNDNDARKLVEICCDMLKPKGLLSVTAFESQTAPREISSFVTGEAFRLSLRPQPRLDLPWYYRHNRALITLLLPLSVVKIFGSRIGIREFVFQHE
jgi:SAM-dependent methyltransferase